MTVEVVDIDSQVAAFRKSPEDDHSVTHTQSVTGATIDNRNAISTPVLIMALGILVIAVGMASVAIGVANQAERQAQNAEREARVALDKTEELRIKNEVNTVLIQGYLGKGK